MRFKRLLSQRPDNREDAATQSQPAADTALEAVPLPILALDTENRVAIANAAARAMFGIDATRLPLSLLEATREVRIEEAVTGHGGEPAEVSLVHQSATVLIHTSQVATGRLVFIQDVTELRRLERVRQEFLANLGHELKTPLASLRLAAESLLGDPPADVRERFARRVVTEAEHLRSILDNLRQLTEIEGGQVQLAIRKVNLRDLVGEIAGRLPDSHPLENRIPPELEIEADMSKVSQALRNLLDNAAKFSPATSAIEVDAQTTGGGVAISVRDHGPGIPPELWQRVFERFYKADRARSREVGGSGLGLAITKHLVEAHRGTIDTRLAEGGGQVFTVRLPRRTLTLE